MSAPTVTLSKPPAHLKPATRKFWAEVAAGYTLEAHHRKLLTLACEAWDSAQAAREVLAEHGRTYEDRFGAPHARPEVAFERDGQRAFLAAMKALNLDLDPPPEPRPARRLGGGR